MCQQKGFTRYLRYRADIFANRGPLHALHYRSMLARRLPLAKTPVGPKAANVEGACWTVVAVLLGAGVSAIWLKLPAR